MQFYCNGHGWLAQKLKTRRIGFTQVDNAFVRLDDFARAQQLADGFKPEQLHRILDRYARQCCPVHKSFGQGYHRSLLQVEYATDLVFRSQEMLAPLYEQLSRQAVLGVKAEQIATFLGKKITPPLAQEIGNRFATRIEGTCIKHRLGKVQVKMYDKYARVLRIETTVNDVSFFKHHRKVEHRDRPSTRQLAPLKKSIYSLIDLRQILLGCNRRYLEYLSALDDHSAGQRALSRLTDERCERPADQGPELLQAHRAATAAGTATSAVQYPRSAARRSDGFAAPRLGGCALARAETAACPRRDQTGHRNLSLLPHALGARRHRRRLLAHGIQYRSRFGHCKVTNSSPFLSTVKS